MNTRSFRQSAFSYLSVVGKALSTPVRLEILDLLSHGPRTVENLAEYLEQSVANTSHHLQALKRARLVQSSRDGLHQVYSLAGPDVTSLIQQLERVAESHLSELQRLREEYFNDPAGFEAIDKATLIARMQEDAVQLIDLRSEEEFERSHIPGAISIPWSELESRLDALDADKIIVAYCRGHYCSLSAKAAQLLRERGFDVRRSELSVHDFSEDW